VLDRRDRQNQRDRRSIVSYRRGEIGGPPILCQTAPSFFLRVTALFGFSGSVGCWALPFPALGFTYSH
jgi:hypothetical protein